MKNHAALRRRASGGFSLMELLVTVSVAGTLASVAVPSFSRLVQDNRRTAVVNELMAAALLARAESARLGRSVVVCGFDGREHRCSGADWSRGWFATQWTDRNQDGRVDPDELAEPPLRIFVNDQPLVSVRAGGFGNAPSPSGIAVLRPFDRFSSNGTVTVCDRRGPEAARALILSGNGRARIAGRAADGGELACP